MRISDWSSDVCSSDLCCCAWNSFSAMEASESVEKSRRKSTLESPSATAIGSPSTSSRSTSTKSINGSMARLVPALHGIRFECGAGLGFRDRILSLVPGNEVIALAKRDPHRCLDEAAQQQRHADGQRQIGHPALDADRLVHIVGAAQRSEEHTSEL